MIVRAKILASMKKKLYICHVSINSIGDVVRGYCTCIGGITGQCKHIFALLWHILDYVIQEKSQINNERVPCTSTARTWGCGSKKTPAISQKPFSELRFIKHDSSKPIKNTLINIEKRRERTQKHLNVKITPSILENDSKIIYDVNLLMFAEILESNEFEPASTDDILTATQNPLMTEITNPQPTSSHYKLKKSNIRTRINNNFTESIVNDVDNNPMSLPSETKWNNELINYITANDFDLELLSTFSMTIEEARKLEEDTRKQSQCPLWFLEKEKRISSSNFSAIIRRKKQITRAFHQKIWPQTRNRIQSAFMKLGFDNEETATMKYLTVYPHYTAFRCGLCVNPGIPFLCTSPDRLIYDTNSKTCHLLEIKTLAKGGLVEKLSIKECIKNGYADFLNSTNDNNFYLKENHSHYYQIQGQLALTGLPFCDLLVDSGQEIFLQRIYFNQEEWVDIHLPSLAMFHFQYFGRIPE